MRAILIIILLLSPIVGMSQNVLFRGSPSMLTYHQGALGADSILKIPFADTTGIGGSWPDSLRRGAIMVNSADSTLYYYDGVKWKKVVGGTGGTADTNFIRNQNAYRQDGNFRINGAGETSRMIVASEEFVPQVENLDTSSYGLYVAKVLDPPYDPLLQGSAAWILQGTGVHKISDGFNIRTALSLFSEYDLDGMTNATGWVQTAGVEIYDQANFFQTPLERPLIWRNIGIFNSSSRVTNTGSASVDSSVSNYGIISGADWRKGTFSNAEAKRYNLYLGTTGLDPVPAPNFISGPTMFSKATINDPIQNRDGGVVITHGPSMDSFNQDFSVKILGNMVYKNGDEGAGKILTSSADGTVNIVDPGSIVPEGAYIQGGNAFGETAVLGTTDNQALEIKANDNVALRINPDASVQYTDGTQGDNKILMSSADGTLSAQSQDSVLKGVWRSGVVNDMGTHATLRTSADTITIRSGNNILMQSVGNRMAFNDIVRGSADGTRFLGGAAGSAGMPISFDARLLAGATGNRVGILMSTQGSTPTSISVLQIGRSRSAEPTWTGITDENWGATAATTNYFMRVTSFQPSSTNWFLFTQNPVKSQLSGNLLLGATTDNGHKLQIQGGAYIQNAGASFNQLILKQPFTPDNTADPDGEVGAMAWDEDYIYIKTSAGWKRSALSTF